MYSIFFVAAKIWENYHKNLTLGKLALTDETVILKRFVKAHTSNYNLSSTTMNEVHNIQKSYIFGST